MRCSWMWDIVFGLGDVNSDQEKIENYTPPTQK